MLKSIKSVLVAFTEEGRGEKSSALAYALSLSQQADAHLTLQAASMRYAIPASLVGAFGAELVATENRRIEALAEAFAEKAKSSADLAGVTTTVETPTLVYANLCDRLLAYARVHDLAILDMEKDPVQRDRGMIEAVLFESGRPVLIVPPSCETFSAKRVLIAWDGSAAAARAVGDAMPFLDEADEVEILSISGEKDLSTSIAGADLAPHLARHGIAVTVRNVALTQPDVAGEIRHAATSFGADLVVCGAYKHSRLREWLLGGVTQSLLKDSTLPILMSH
ncbi:MAG TPA: universal stress protein [Bosea sp. (in: a-proteobacteria)]|jgi:nucleotide-binding universal stress UspA family protein|uniref:universal stress protein n=1 Tax=Bosea sp. (in: a-proteobacteria) TaxID=1871050 RepID=UPI002E10E287|nr:universal stress protein [Bosea sp. (in: a-proteobacteria)]